MGPVILDSSVMIAWLNPDDAHHARATQRLTELSAAGHRFAVSAVGYSELMSNKRADRRAAIREVVDALGADAVIPVDREIAERAGELRARRPSLRTPDALIAATAAVRGSGDLLTADRAMSRLEGAEYLGGRRR